MLTRLVKRFYRWRKWHWFVHVNTRYDAKERITFKRRHCETCGQEQRSWLVIDNWEIVKEGDTKCN